MAIDRQDPPRSGNAMQLFLQQTYSYRNRHELATGLLFGLAGVIIVCVALAMAGAAVVEAEGTSLHSLLFALFFIPIGAVLGWAGARHIRAWRRALTINVQIDSTGVTVGDTEVEWAQIPWIGGKRLHPFARHVSLCYGDPEVSHIGYLIPLSPALDRSGFHQLMQQLETMKLPALEVGRVVGPSFKLLSRLPPAR